MPTSPPSSASASSARDGAPGGGRRDASASAGFEPLLPAEALVLQAAQVGGIAKVGFQRPRAATAVVRVRAEFLAWLACRPRAEMPIAESRLQLLGACIVGTLDLRDAEVPGSLWFYRCVFIRAPLLGGARIRGSLSFPDSGLPGLRAKGCRIDGELALNAGCNVYGELQLTRAVIGLDLNAERLQLQPSAKFGHALPCRLCADGLQVGGSLRLNGGVEANGEWRLRAARIHGDLDAGAARLSADLDAGGTRGMALDLSRAVIGGSVRLNAGFAAAGQIDLQRVRIGADLDCDNAEFDAVGDAGWGGAATLRLDQARIGGALMLRHLHGPLQIASLTDARVNTLADDASTWGRQHLLDGFAYRRIAPGSPLDAVTRIGWLERQHGSALGAAFRPGPWRRVVKVLGRSGQAHAASTVSLALERHLRRAGLIGSAWPQPMRGVLRIGHAAHGVFAGHGQRPGRLLGLLVLVWAGCGVVYWAAAAAGAVATIAPVAPTGPAFHPFLFSLDLLLPGLDLGQARQWVPSGQRVGAWATALAGLMAAEAICGWLALLTAVVALTGRGRDA